MGAYIAFATYGIPCLIALIWFLTPSGKRWLRKNNLI